MNDSDWVDLVRSHVNNLQAPHKELDEAALWKKAVQSRVSGLSVRNRRARANPARKSRPGSGVLAENMEAEECRQLVSRLAKNLYYQTGDVDELRKVIYYKLKNARARSRIRTDAT